MATIINTPQPVVQGEEPGSGAAGMVVGAVLVVIVLLALILGMQYLKPDTDLEPPTTTPPTVDIHLQTPPETTNPNP